MGISPVRNDAEQALELLQAVPRFRPWSPNYYVPPATPPSVPLSAWSLQDIGSALRGEPNRLTGERSSSFPREALVSELTRRAGQLPSTSQPWTDPGDYAPIQLPPGALAAVPPTEPSDNLPGPPPAAPPAPAQSPAGHPPAQVRARSGTAVVTPSAGSGVATPQAPQAPTQSPEQQTPAIPLAAPQGFQRAAPLEAEPGQRMMEFGLAMLASRSPYFGQTVGEAGQAVIAGDRTRRQENREQQKADTEQIYREGILRLEAAQQAWRQNPRNPEAVMNLARAQHYLASIETDRIRANAAATNASEAVRDRVVGQRADENGNMWNIFQSGRMAPLQSGEGGPSFRDTSNTPRARAYNGWLSNRANAATRIATASPPFNRVGDAEAWRNEAWADWLRRNPEPPNPDAPAAAAAGPRRIRLED